MSVGKIFPLCFNVSFHEGYLINVTPQTSFEIVSLFLANQPKVMPSTWFLSAMEIIFSHIYTSSYQSHCLECMQGRRCSLLGTSQSEKENGRSNSADEKLHHVSAHCKTDGGESAGEAVGTHSPEDAQGGLCPDDPTRWLNVRVEPQERFMLSAGGHMRCRNEKGYIQKGDRRKEAVACPVMFHSCLGGENTRLPEYY